MNVNWYSGFGGEGRGWWVLGEVSRGCSKLRRGVEVWIRRCGVRCGYLGRDLNRGWCRRDRRVVDCERVRRTEMKGVEFGGILEL